MDTTEIRSLREANAVASTEGEEGTTYGIAVRALKRGHDGMNDMLSKIDKDGTLTKDGKIYERAEYFNVFNDSINNTLNRLQTEVDSKISHHTKNLFSNNPTLTDVEKAMISTVSDNALNKPLEYIDNQAMANVVNAFSHMGLYPKNRQGLINDGLNMKYTPEDKAQLASWEKRNKNLQDVKHGLQQYTNIHKPNQTEIDRVNANMVAKTGSRIHRSA